MQATESEKGLQRLYSHIQNDAPLSKQQEAAHILFPSLYTPEQAKDDEISKYIHILIKGTKGRAFEKINLQREIAAILETEAFTHKNVASLLGRLFLRKSPIQAEPFLKDAAIQGNTTDQYLLGRELLTTNQEEGAQFLKMAADNGHIKAADWLAYTYRENGYMAEAAKYQKLFDDAQPEETTQIDRLVDTLAHTIYPN